MVDGVRRPVHWTRERRTCAAFHKQLQYFRLPCGGTARVISLAPGRFSGTYASRGFLGVEIRRSSGTSQRHAAQEFEEQLRRDLWRQIKLGEQHWTWADALSKCELANGHQKSWDRTKRSLKILNEYLPPDTLLAEIDYDSLLKIRSLLQLRTSKGNGWKTKRLWKKSTVNRVLAVAGFHPATLRER
jgi:hypothetical protein